MLPVIETERLIIRPPQLGDDVPLDKIIKRSIKALQPWMPWSNNPLITTQGFIEKSVSDWESNQQTDFPMILIHKKENTMIGCSGYNSDSKPRVPYFEIAYWLDTNYLGQGLATETVIALTRYAFEQLRAHRVQLSIQAENIKSIHVAKRCGFTHEATLHHACFNIENKKPTDVLVFACFNEQNLPA